MSPRRPNLLFDQVIIIKKPLRRGGDALSAADGVGHQLMGFPENLFVFGKSAQQAILPAAPLARFDLMPACQRPGVLLQLPNAEKFGPKGLLVFGADSAARLGTLGQLSLYPVIGRFERNRSRSRGVLIKNSS